MAITLLEMMLQADLVTPGQCDEALQNRVFFGGKIGTNLIELGFVTEEDLARFLSRKLGVPYVPPKRLLNLSEDVLKLIPRDLALKHQVIPIGLEKRRLLLAMADPADLRAIDDIAFITGHIIKPRITPEIRLNQALAQYYQVKMDARFQQIIDRMGPPRDFSEPAGEPPRVLETPHPEPPPHPLEPPAEDHDEEPMAPGEPPEKSPESPPPDESGTSDEIGEEEWFEAPGTMTGPEPAEEIESTPTPEHWEMPLPEGELTEPVKLDVESGTEGMDWPAFDAASLESTAPGAEKIEFDAEPELGMAAPAEAMESAEGQEAAGEETLSLPEETAEPDIIEDLDEADIVEEEAPKVQIEPVTRDPVSRALAHAEDRDEIAAILLDHLGKAFSKVALFVVRQTYASGWLAINDGAEIPDFANLRIPLSRPSVLKSVAQGKSYFLGALPETPLNDRILNALGRGGFGQALVMPLLIAGRVVILLYLEGGQTGSADQVEELQRLLKKTSLAFEILIARDKILMA